MKRRLFLLFHSNSSLLDSHSSTLSCSPQSLRSLAFSDHRVNMWQRESRRDMVSMTAVLCIIIVAAYWFDVPSNMTERGCIWPFCGERKYRVLRSKKIRLIKIVNLVNLFPPRLLWVSHFSKRILYQNSVNNYIWYLSHDRWFITIARFWAFLKILWSFICRCTFSPTSSLLVMSSKELVE